jgi:hypothetical protein
MEILFLLYNIAFSTPLKCHLLQLKTNFNKPIKGHLYGIKITQTIEPLRKTFETTGESSIKFEVFLKNIIFPKTNQISKI